MQPCKRWLVVVRCLTVTLAFLLVVCSAYAEEILNIVPLKYDCGVVKEGDPAAMLAIIENISKHEVNVVNVKTN